MKRLGLIAVLLLTVRASWAVNGYAYTTKISASGCGTAGQCLMSNGDCTYAWASTPSAILSSTNTWNAQQTFNGDTHFLFDAFKVVGGAAPTSTAGLSVSGGNFIESGGNISLTGSGTLQVLANGVNRDLYFNSTDKQLGIGTDTADASAKIDIVSTTQGLLPPRMTTTQRDAISSPAEGLTIYNTSTHHPNYWNGTAWTQL